MLLLGGCPAPGPTENPFDTPEDGPPVVSVCYSALVADRESDVEPVARAACAEAGIADATLRYWKKSHILNDCPLFKKTRATYYCEPAEPAEPAGPAGRDFNG